MVLRCKKIPNKYRKTHARRKKNKTKIFRFHFIDIKIEKHFARFSGNSNSDSQIKKSKIAMYYITLKAPKTRAASQKLELAEVFILNDVVGVASFLM